MQNKKTIVISAIVIIAAAAAVFLVRGINANGTGGENKEGRKLTVAVAENSKPNSFTDLNGELTGYEVEILQAIDEKLTDHELTIEAVSQSAEEIGIDTGKYALIAQGFFKTPERAEKYLIPEENTGVSLMKIFTLADRTDITGMEDLADKKLAPVPPNGGIFNFLTKYNEEHPDSQIAFDTAENVPIANRFQELLDGKYDAVIWPSANLDLSEIEKGLNASFRATAPVNINATYFLIAKNQEVFYGEVNRAISELKAEGRLKEISEKYFGEDIFQYQ